MDRKQLVSFSEIASFLRVPLMVLVVCIHGVGSDIQTIDFVNHLPVLSVGNIYIYIYNRATFAFSCTYSGPSLLFYFRLLYLFLEGLDKRGYHYR